MTDYAQVSLLSETDAAYIAGLIDGEGTITLSRKHAHEKRQLSVTVSSTELPLLEFIKIAAGAGKITRKRVAKAHHAPSYTYAIWNRQALSLLAQVEPFLKSYKRRRARVILDDYVRLTPRNGKYSPELAAQRARFESAVLALRARDIGEDAAGGDRSAD